MGRNDKLNKQIMETEEKEFLLTIIVFVTVTIPVPYFACVTRQTQDHYQRHPKKLKTLIVTLLKHSTALTFLKLLGSVLLMRKVSMEWILRYGSLFSPSPGSTS